MFSSSTFSTTIPAALPSPQRSPPPQSKPRVRQQHRVQTRTQTDEVIGYVLANKKIFKCPQKPCAELKFGRLADLRRHHDQAHARNRLQFFCPYDGCPRSNAIGGGQGRSFGTRKDKRDEHVKNVHEKDRHSDRFSPDEESY
ncbi:hypothetical protein BS50DRAFT_499054 [Corynespora cassiicola Philippines]|uniref:Uncharacterized protein n=1 Tax=Corynespora cassiicola Philippines TaxID=1448308 RepID=A0A2T2NH27_CORCC|nr:hypothetical protein BS50DRAFT_499054 [Corynespora cassiicola Philippines]